MVDKQTVRRIIDDFLKSSENYLVDIEVKPDNTIVVEIDNDNSITLSDCAALSNFINLKLDRDKEDYNLEVCSAGLGQVFKIKRQYRKNLGNKIEVLTKSGIKHVGVLKTVCLNNITLIVKKQIKPKGTVRKVTVEERISIFFDEIEYAKYSFS